MRISRGSIVSFSGTLLETLSHPEFQRKVYGSVDCGTLLWALQNEKLFEILGTGYYHPVLALTPEADWDEHIARWQAIGRNVFWRDHFNGFWPPEMGFDMKLIPHLKKAGYRYVLVDSEYVDPIDEMTWQELRYRPHIAEYEGEEIVVVVRDRDLSAAQLAGMEYSWFYHEIQERTKWCDFPPLVTTVSDGDNGGWFRNVNPQANFWSYFYKTALDEIRAGNSSMRPTFINEYLDRFGAHGRVTVRRGAWPTDEHHGWDFHQWQGSQAQRDAMVRVHEISKVFHEVKDDGLDAGNRRIRSSTTSWGRRTGGCFAPKPAAISTGARRGSTGPIRTWTRSCSPPGSQEPAGIGTERRSSGRLGRGDGGRGGRATASGGCSRRFRYSGRRIAPRRGRWPSRW